MNRAAALLGVKSDASFKRALYVADYNNNVIKIFTNTYYRELGSISNGISGPVSESMDRLGNLYVTNSSAVNVTEYAPGASSPSFTYSAGMISPTAVTVDRHGSVYETDNGQYYGQGIINEYFQGINSVSASCPTLYGIEPTGVAVDSSGDVFLDLGSSFGMAEYKGGLKGCHGTLLGFGAAHDIVLDSQDNLIIASSTYLGTPGVYVVPPPYTPYNWRSIGSGIAVPWSLSINKKNKLVFVTDAANNDVTVINYETGQNVKVLGTPYGITNANAVVDGPNAVY